MKPGRNDPCYCGSGRKFKHCCLQGPSLTATTSPTTSSLQASSVPAAQALGIRPYVVAQMVEQPGDYQEPELRVRVARHMRDNWTIRKVAALTTEGIEEQLRTYGVAYSRPRFVAMTAHRTSAWTIASEWERTSALTCRGKEVDFLGLGACELWKRLVPERPSVEMIDGWMQEGYRLKAARQPVATIELWWQVWQTLLPRFAKDIKTMRAAEPICCGRQSLFNWCQDLEQCLSEMSRDEPRAIAVGIAYCGQWRRQFVDEEVKTQLNFARAHAEFLFRDGQDQAGHELLRSAVRRWPDNPWGYIAIADRYTFDALLGVPRDDERAELWLRRGLATASPEDDSYGVLYERLAELNDWLTEEGPIP